MSETIIWTAVPKSANGANLVVSAHVSFHLGGPGTTVNDYPNAAKWNPANLSFTLTFVGFNNTNKQVLFTGKPPAQAVAGLWQQLFPSNGPVVPFNGQSNPAQKVQTFSTEGLSNYVLPLYAVNAASSFFPAATAKQLYAMPSITAADIFFSPTYLKRLTDTATNPTFTASQLTGIQQQMVTKYEADSNAARAAGNVPTDPQTLMYEAWRFKQPYAPLPHPPAPPTVDFHQALAMVNQYGPLMRSAGVVFDLPFTLAPTFKGGVGTLYLEVTGMEPGATVQYMLTHVQIANGLCIADSNTATNAIVGGYMQMANSFVYEFDVDGTAERIMDFASTVRQSNMLPAASTAATPQPLPSGRNGGIAVALKNRVAATVKTRTRSEAIRTAPTNGLFLDDLFKGWRPDIKYKDVWYSLTARTADYYIGANFTEIPGITDEGQISSALTSDPTGTTVRQHENVFTWEGWSLVVEKPGTPIDDANGGYPSTSQRYKNFTQWMKQPSSTDKFYKLVANKSLPPKSLPPLRYGHWYSVRARAVDLAGNSHALADVPSTQIAPQAESSIPYTRFNPIPSPTLHPVVPNPTAANPTITPGNSASVMVIHKYATPASDNEKETRWVTPPEGGVSFAEAHGMLDPMATQTGGPDSIWKLINGIDLLPQIPAFVGATPPPLPYLPDPTANGATLAVPYVPNPSSPLVPYAITANYYSSTQVWPNPANLFIQITPGTVLGATATATQLSIVLEPGRDITCQLSSSTTIKWLVQFAAVWMLELILHTNNESLVPAFTALSPDAGTQLKRAPEHPHNLIIKAIKINPQLQNEELIVKMLMAGMNGMISPGHPVRMIHACQIPEDVPSSKFFNSIYFTRDEYSTQITAGIDVNSHNWSTSEIELQIETVGLTGDPGEPVDYISEPVRTTLTRDRKGIVLVQPVTVDPVHSVTEVKSKDSYEMHDTKCHFVKSTAICKTRFRDYFPANMPAGTPFTRNYVADGVQIVPASRRPDPLELEYIMPSFLWGQLANGSLTYSGRKGNLLRIYLRRPWFSSGTGEMLGIVLLNDNDIVEPDSVTFQEMHHTMIGADPVFAGTGVGEPPSPINFPTSGAPIMRVALAEDPTQYATVLPYQPEFDPDRQMWFVDLDIEPGGYYTPFIRLVMARVQPFALTKPDDLRLSPLVVADITQLQPDRIAFTNRKGNQIIVVLGGIPGQTMYGLNKVFGFLQIQTSADPDGGWIDYLDPKSGQPVWTEIPFVNYTGAFTPPMNWTAPVATPHVDISRVGNPVKAAPQAETRKPLFPQIQGVHNGVRGLDLIHITPPVTPPSATPGIFDLGTVKANFRIVLREYEIHGGVSPNPFLKPDSYVAGRLVHMDVLNIL